MAALAQQVLDALPLTVYTTDLDGRITSTNRSWCQFAEHNGAPDLARRDVFLGRGLLAAFSDPSYREQATQAMDALRSGRAKVVSWEFPCDSPTEQRVFLMQVTALRDGHHVTGFAFSTVDITPSHASREALIDSALILSRTIDFEKTFHELSHQLRRAIGAESLTIWLHRDDSHRPQVAFASAGAAPTGAEDLVTALSGDEDVATFPTESAVLLAAPMSALDRSRLGAMVVECAPFPNRQAREAAIRVVVTLAAQASAALERARLVGRVGEKRRLEAIGEVATGVAHELRNPLFGISSAAQLLRFRARDDVIVEKNVGRILREVERLNRMVTSLLDFGRPKPVVLAPADPDLVLDDLVEGQRGLLESRSLLIQRERPPRSVRCMVDTEQLAQVFLNLLVNAAAHAPAASDLVFASQTLGNDWQFKLTNGGPAIPPDILPRVFEVFFSTKPGGTGIGLALCQRIMAEHRGTIAIESSAESGTTVTLTLPIIAA